MIHPLLKAAIIGLISSIVIAPITLIKLYKALELRLYDQRLKLRPLQPVTDKIVIIAIDDESIKTLGRWPWTGDRHAALVETLTSFIILERRSGKLRTCNILGGSNIDKKVLRVYRAWATPLVPDV